MSLIYFKINHILKFISVYVYIIKLSLYTVCNADFIILIRKIVVIYN